MTTMSKSYTSQIRGASVSADGKIISVNVTWTPDTPPPGSSTPGSSTPGSSTPGSSTQKGRVQVTSTPISVAGGKVVVAGVAVADAPVDLTNLGTALAAKAAALFNSLVSAGKIGP